MYTALTAARAIHDGTISAEALCQQYLQRILDLNPALNALVTLDEAGALASARLIDRERAAGKALPLLAGVPVSIKDAFATRGLRTTSSHPPLRQHQTLHDATLVARLRAAGAVIVGKSNLPELAGDPQCWSPLFGATDNPWRRGYTPGGSSGGSAATIASGLSLLELGSDLAGSIRIPAAYCGIVGHKATENRLPRSGHIPHLPQYGRSVWHCLSFGAMGHCVADVQAAFSLLAGSDGEDSTVPPLPVRQVSLPARPLRIAWWDDFDGLPLCPRTRTALQETVSRLQQAGCEVTRIKPPGFDVAKTWQAFGVLAGNEVGLGMPPLARVALRRLRYFLPRSHQILRALGRGLRFDMRDYNQALQLREQQIQALESLFADHDVWLCPVAPTTAYPAQPIKSSLQKPPVIEVAGQQLPYFSATLSMTVPFSLTGSPVVSLPVGVFDGLPVGLQLVGKRWHDEELLAIAVQLEGMLPARQQPPGFEQASRTAASHH